MTPAPMGAQRISSSTPQRGWPISFRLDSSQALSSGRASNWWHRAQMRSNVRIRACTTSWAQPFTPTWGDSSGPPGSTSTPTTCIDPNQALPTVPSGFAPCWGWTSDTKWRSFHQTLNLAELIRGCIGSACRGLIDGSVRSSAPLVAQAHQPRDTSPLPTQLPPSWGSTLRTAGPVMNRWRLSRALEGNCPTR